MSGDLDLGCVDVREFLRMLGIENVRDDGKEARFSCPYPAHSFGDKNPSAYMNLHTTAFICFSCGASGNAITFLADLKNVPRLVAKNWIAEKWAPHFANIEDMEQYVLRMFAQQQREAEPEIFTPLDESILNNSPIYSVDWNASGAPWADYLRGRGFTGDILNIFGFTYDQISDRPCLTVRTRSGELVGFKGRAWREDQWPKYMVIGDTLRTIEEHGERYGFAPYDASHHVFAANIAQPDDGKLIVCEGELNVVSMYQKGFANVVGPSGSTLSDRQVKDIVSMCSEVILLFDTDASTQASYDTAKIKLLKAMKSFEPFVDVRVCEDHEGDPAEMDADELHHLVANAKSSTLVQIENMLHDSAST